MKWTIWIGFDPREMDAYSVAERSINHHLSQPIVSYPLALEIVQRLGLYSRKHIQSKGRLWDEISDAPMSTEFAISRFLTPCLADSGWALFVDCDVMARDDIRKIFAAADPAYAVQVVKHPTPVANASGTKMDGQIQTPYRCKNWSSVMLFNVGHPANRALTPELVNSLPGRELHRFCWLRPDQIGDLDPRWNHLVGINQPDPKAGLAHFTLGIPRMAGYQDCEFADEWRAWLA